ncbi:MAG: hypothetical protein HZB92_06495 [Euryarchaeota archaeon]|nr:hypothetical protein [Euryarchaeota archaeon]
MSAIASPVKHQCALFKSSRKHFVKALEAYSEKKNAHGDLTAATETGEAGGDAELSGWLNNATTSYDSSGTLDMGVLSTIETRYNEYNRICGWGLEDFDPSDPLKVPGGGGIS